MDIMKKAIKVGLCMFLIIVIGILIILGYTSLVVIAMNINMFLGVIVAAIPFAIFAGLIVYFMDKIE